MQADRKTSDEWDVCPSGELSRMVARLDARGRRARTKQLAGAVGVSTAVVAVAVILAGSLTGSLSGGDASERPHYGGISCATCFGHFADYHTHLTGEAQIVDAALVASLQTHLAECDLCGPKFEKSYPGVLAADIGSTPSVLFAARPQFSIGTHAVRW